MIPSPPGQPTAEQESKAPTARMRTEEEKPGQEWDGRKDLTEMEEQAKV